MIDGNTPPAGFTVGENGRAVPSNHLINAIRASVVNEVSTSNQGETTSAVIPLPPAPSGIPPIIMTPAQTAGQSFGRSGSRVAPSDSTLASVTVNVRPHVGPIFDSNGNRIA